jgi:hypothetical protein
MHLPPIKRIIPLISILLVSILAFFLVIHSDNVKRKLHFGSSDSFNTVNVNTEQEDHFLKQNSIQVYYEGLKNDTFKIPEHITKTIEIELGRANWNEALAMEDLYNLYHETVFAQSFPSESGKSKSFYVITYTNSGANHCHGCRGGISLFKFQQKIENWQLDHKFIAFGYGDEYGLEPQKIKFVRIGNKNKLAVIVHTGYSYMGHDKETESVYTEVNDSMKLVFDFTSYEYYNDYPSDIEYTDGYSDMRIIKSNKAYFDIETKCEGIEWKDKSSVRRFVFNGKEYIEK